MLQKNVFKTKKDQLKRKNALKVLVFELNDVFCFR